jgi:hypothetical protein
MGNSDLRREIFYREIPLALSLCGTAPHGSSSISARSAIPFVVAYLHCTVAFAVQNLGVKIDYFVYEEGPEHPHVQAWLRYGRFSGAGTQLWQECFVSLCRRFGRRRCTAKFEPPRI